MNFLVILMGTVFVNNIILTQFLGMCPFFGVSKRTETALGMGIAVMFVMTLSSFMTHLVYHYILKPNLLYLETVVFVLIIASIVQFIEVFMKKKFTLLHSMLGVYLPLITTNCAILGVSLLNIKNEYTLIESIVSSIGVGIGFTLAIVLMSNIREKYNNNPDIPESFKGFPLALFIGGLMSIAFMGFQGLI